MCVWKRTTMVLLLLGVGLPVACAFDPATHTERAAEQAASGEPTAAMYLAEGELEAIDTRIANRLRNYKGISFMRGSLDEEQSGPAYLYLVTASTANLLWSSWLKKSCNRGP